MGVLLTIYLNLFTDIYKGVFSYICSFMLRGERATASLNKTVVKTKEDE